MHGLTVSNRVMTKQEYNKRLAAARLGDNICNHMAYIYMIILYDKFDISFKRLCNINSKLIELRERYQDDDDESVTSEILYQYCVDKKIPAYDFVKSIPASQKLFMADVRKGARTSVYGMRDIEAGFLKTILLTVWVLKKNYRFSNDKITEFLSWVKYYIDSYTRKQPGINEYYCNDDIIVGSFMEDEGQNIRTGERVEVIKK